MTALFPPWIGVPVRSPVPYGTATAPAESASPAQPAVPVRYKGGPAAGEFYADRLPFGGQSVPLPPGRWIALAVANPTAGKPGTPAVGSAFLGLIQGNNLIAAAVVSGTLKPGDAGFAAPLEAQNGAFYYKRVIAAVDSGPVDIWVCGLTQPSRWNDPLRQAALRVLTQQGLAPPDHLDSAVFRLADKHNWLMAEFMFPDPSETSSDTIRPWTDLAMLSDDEPLPHLEKVRRWGKAWHDVMVRGFNGGTLGPEVSRISLP